MSRFVLLIAGVVLAPSCTAPDIREHLAETPESGDAEDAGSVADAASEPCRLCGPNAHCENGGCVCDSGFESNGEACVDVNECKGSHGCEPGTCRNEAGSYTCTCPVGYSGSGSARCSDIDECGTDNGGCGLSECTNAAGTFACGDCPPGFVKAGNECKWNEPHLDGLFVSDAVFYTPFEPGIVSYVVQANSATAAVTLTPTLPEPGIGRADIEIDDEKVGSGRASRLRSLRRGDTEFRVTVSAESGTSRSYGLLVRRGWTFGTYVKATNPDISDFFGNEVALSSDGSTLAVASSSEDSAARGIGGNQHDDSADGAGAVYVFRRGGESWQFEAYLKASNAEAGDSFGCSLGLSDNGSTLVVGAAEEDGKGKGAGSVYQDDNSVQNAGAAYVFERTGSTWVQSAYLKASNTAGSQDLLGNPLGQRFATDVGISGDASTIVVAASAEAGRSSNIDGDQGQDFFNAYWSGAVYVFRRSDISLWPQEAYIKSPHSAANMAFGGAVALSRDGSSLAVVESRAGAAGVVYMYQRLSSWALQQTLANPASQAGADDGFGAAIALSSDGQTLAVGDTRQDRSGTVYLFSRSGDEWVQGPSLKASNARADAGFGSSLALSERGDVLAVGSPFETSATILGGSQAEDGVVGAGAVYMFGRAEQSWTQVAYVKAPNTHQRHRFGHDLALDASGTKLAVGALQDNGGAVGIDGDLSDQSISDSGAVFVYR